jgi:hypothetical protein
VKYSLRFVVGLLLDCLLVYLLSSCLWMWLYQSQTFVAVYILRRLISLVDFKGHLRDACSSQTTFGGITSSRSRSEPSKIVDREAKVRSIRNEVSLLGCNPVETKISVLCPTRDRHWQSDLLCLTTYRLVFSERNSRAQSQLCQHPKTILARNLTLLKMRFSEL